MPNEASGHGKSLCFRRPRKNAAMSLSPPQTKTHSVKSPARMGAEQKKRGNAQATAGKEAARLVDKPASFHYTVMCHGLSVP
jgi:hypothetical protein